jgi:hypothetical protein
MVERLIVEPYLISGVNSINTFVIVSSGGTIRTANSDGFTASAAAGTVRTDNRTYSSGGHYVFNAKHKPKYR